MSSYAIDSYDRKKWISRKPHAGYGGGAAQATSKQRADAKGWRSTKALARQRSLLRAGGGPLQGSVGGRRRLEHAFQERLSTNVVGLNRPRPSVRDGARFEAAEALKQAAVNPEDLEAIGQAAGSLRRTAHLEVDRRPRHAAVALAAWDAIECTDKPFAFDARRRVFWEASQLLLKQLISTKEEMSLLDKMDAAHLERVPPFEDTFADQVLAELNGEDIR